MFSSSNEETVIAEGLKIEGKVKADGLVRVRGKVNGDVRCTELEVAGSAVICGTVVADSVIVDGTVEGPIRGSDVVLKSHAHVTGDIHHTSLTIEKGAIFDGRSKQSEAGQQKSTRKTAAKKSPVAANDDTHGAKQDAAA